MLNRKKHWEGVYSSKSTRDVSWYQQEPGVSLNIIRDACLSSDQAIIDVGAGASTLVDHLYKTGYRNIAVLDISSTALSCAQNRLGNVANKIHWYETDILNFNPPQRYSLWHDRAVFHFLTTALDRKNYISVLKRVLTPGGHLIIAAFAIGGPTQCSNLNIVQYNNDKLQSTLGDDFELIKCTNETHVTPDNKEQKFSYFHFIRRPAA